MNKNKLVNCITTRIILEAESSCFTKKTIKLRIHMRNRKQLEDSEHVVTSDPFGTFASKFAIGIRKFLDIAQIIQTC